jgi:hypothetical protein
VSIGILNKIVKPFMSDYPTTRPERQLQTSNKVPGHAIETFRLRTACAQLGTAVTTGTAIGTANSVIIECNGSGQLFAIYEAEISI